jgi:hypothetical protein
MTTDYADKGSTKPAPGPRHPAPSDRRPEPVVKPKS